MRAVSQDKLSKLDQMTIIGVNAISENYEYGDNIHLCIFGHQTLESHSHAERNQCKHFQSRCLRYQVWAGTDLVMWGKKGEEYVELESRVVFVHWAHREKRRGTAACEGVNVL